ncbi:hypothetical protein ASPSYDRAFT_48874 [Aspergillus sydowii CBS 593.65]|uniref:Heterokaryon incompatibility domain-containing protein n=1 Tax=Aspergillus sydowii CBS 593.65 TaxID=1036612 RepID=A0A1L9T8B7_9EURO|nr:uncharacterized protein ASPSYDRAFT_48874 [Aspergillus sydowii CBS 593.65]OJJ55666.1 hypothetical protein ASPSYDRAFT_48874 [Aspergillus sydowii CBS 593.65]
MSSPILCDWCQTTVFDKHLLALIGRGTAPTSLNQDPFAVMIDPLAYFGNRNALAGFRRSFGQNTELLLRNAARGCIFCILLRNIRGGLRGDFEFSITVQDPWKWSTVTVAAHGDENTNLTGYFRVYKTVSPTKLASSGSVFSNPQLPEQDANISPANNDLLQHEGSLPRQLVRDCRAVRVLVDDCTANHPNCKPRESLGFPSLLLEITGTSASPAVRLIKASDIKVVPIRYVCLSYCWGGIQPNMTTTSRLDSYIAGIDTAEIPETILDAIRVSIGMGYQYLWVDAFCIVQDSEQEKIAELGKMASIYSGAIFTICVMSAKSATEGFLRQAYSNCSDDQSIRTWHADIRDAISQVAAASLEIRSDFSNEDIFDSPILERGWTFQEALLSPRLVMFFAHGQRPTLRCSTHTVQSDGGRIAAHPKPLVNLRELEQVVERAKPKAEYYIQTAKAEEWVTIVKQFSQRSFTYQADKMPAIMGIVLEWKALFMQGQYWAGLWSKTLAKDLIWKARTDYSPRAACESYVAPSWSWASRAHPVYYQSLGDMLSFEGAYLFEVVSCEVIPVHEDLPNGAIKSAKLTVKCIAELVDLGAPESEDVSFTVSSGGVNLVFDDSPRPRDIRKAWLLSINDEEPYNLPHGIGIAVAEVGITDADGTKLYKRIGIFVCSGRGLEGPQRTFTLI